MKPLKLVSLLAAISIGIYLMQSKTPKNSSLLVSISNSSFSTDPFDFDYLAHHVAFKSVMGTLTTKHNKTGLSGLLAKSWSSNDDHTTWTFTLRSDITFENGESITTSHVKSTFTRLAMVVNKRKTKDIVLESIRGFKDIISLESDFHGIQTKGNQVVFHLEKPLVKFPLSIAFGFYAITHPSQYDSKTGEWLNKKRFISSSNYRIDSFTKEEVKLGLRQDFPQNVRHQHAFEEVTISTRDLPTEETDVVVGDFNLNLDDFNFLGSDLGAVDFGRIVTWNNPQSPMYIKQNRELVRDIFYSAISKTDLYTSKSFIAAQGNEDIAQPTPDRTKADFELKVLNLNKKSALLDNRTARDILGESFSNYGIKLADADCKGSDIRSQYDPNLKDYCFDFAIRGVGINILAPKDSIHFMLNSGQGIRMPDPSGELNRINKEKDSDYGLFNKVVHDDSIIMPFRHISVSIWYKEDSVDVSELNNNTPPIDFSWLGPL